VVRTILKFGKGVLEKMNSAIEFYKTLNFGRKVQVLRTLVLIPTIISLLAWHFVPNTQVRFYLETWVGASLVLVIALLLVEIVYEVKTYDN
jgi:hypothetical protein